ncbi:protein NLRC5-like isoform X2 [Dysidea avara]
MKHRKQRGAKEIFEVAGKMREGLMKRTRDMSSTYAQALQRIYTMPHNKEYSKTFESYAISEMFQPVKCDDGTTVEPKLILINGAPGMGKTTLCKEIAYSWAKGTLLNNISLVLFLSLGHPGVKKIYNVRDLIHYFYDFDQSAVGISTNSAELLTMQVGIDITIILDGYDEFSSTDDNLLVNKIIKRKILPHCKVIVTSRPIASERLQKIADITVEVLGFTEESQKHYIDHELKGYPNKIAQLSSFLNNNVTINSACYMPIMLTILVYNFKQYDDLPNNDTELYKNFIALTISRFLQKQGHDLPSGELLITQMHQQYVDNLSKLAFEGIMTRKYIFTMKDVERMCSNLTLQSDNFHGLGLLNFTQYTTYKNKVNKCISYNFLHLSIQEYLAALYINSLDISEQFKLLKNTFFVDEFLHTWIMFIQMNETNMCKFHKFLTYCHVTGSSDDDKCKMLSLIDNLNLFEDISGLNDISISNLSGSFQVLCYKNNERDLQKHQTWKSYFNRDEFLEFYDSYFYIDWFEIYLSFCSVDSMVDQMVEIFLLDKNRVDGVYYRMAIRLGRNHNLSVMLLSYNTLMAYRTKLYQISSALTVTNFSLVMENCGSTTNGLSAKQRTLKHVIIEKVDSQELLLIFHFLREVRTLTSINLTKTDLPKNVVENLAEVILHNPFLEVVTLHSNNLRSSAIIVLQALKNTTDLTTLDLSFNNMSEVVVDELANVIKNNDFLQELNLSGNSLQSDGAVILRALKEISYLIILDLNYNMLSEKVVKDLADVIKSNAGLIELSLGYNNFQSSAVVILLALRDVSNLMKLDLSNNNMSEAIVNELASVIKRNTKLEELYLGGNNLQSSAVVILQDLKNISKITKLDLSDNGMSDTVVHELASVIENNTKLEELNLGGNNLQSSAVVILQALKNISNLTTLDLSNNNLSEEVAKDLADVIESNTHLNELILSDNNLQSSTVVILQTLVNTSSLLKLDLSGNKLPETVVNELASVIKSNANLRELHLANNRLQPSTIIILQALKEISSLTVLDLSNNNLSEKIVNYLADVIKHNIHLRKLNLSYNNLRSSAIVVLEALKGISHLNKLDLSGNNMSESVAIELADVIKANKIKIEEICLASNRLHSSATIILQALKETSHLTHLDLDNNNMSEIVVNDLADVIKNNTCLEELYLGNNDLRSSVTIVLQSLKTVSDLTVLDLNNNNMSVAVAEDLSDVIKCNVCLEELYLSSNNLQSSVVVVLQALREICSLRVLDLSDNNLSKAVVNDFADMIGNNPCIEQLYLGDNSLQSSAAVILQALKRVSNLRVLDLDNNNMSRLVVDDLADVVKSNICLEELCLSGNNLQSSVVMVLQALKRFSYLEVLKLDNNSTSGVIVNELNLVMNNNMLVHLSVSCNNLQSGFAVKSLNSSSLNVLLVNDNNFPIATVNSLVAIVTGNNSLTEIRLGGNNLQSGLLDVINSCADLPHLRMLELSRSNCDVTMLPSLASAISAISSLKVLILGGISFNTKEYFFVRSMYQYQMPDMCNNCKMIEIVILEMQKYLLSDDYNNAISICNCTKVFEFANVLEECLKYTSASLSVSKAFHEKTLQIDASSVISILTDVIKDLKILCFEYSNIGEHAARQLALGLDKNNVLEQLWLRGNILCDEGAASILNSSQHLSTLVTLDLSYNNITSESSDGIAAVINSNQLLEEFWLDGNHFQASGILKITYALRKLSTLKLLSLSSNEITEDAAEGISMVINSNVFLETLMLGNNHLQSSGVLKLAKTLRNLKHIKTLDLFNNHITKQSANELGVIFKNCTNLQVLHLGSNALETGVLTIVNAMRSICTLRVLTLSNNNITKEAASCICDVIAIHYGLNILLLGDNDLKTDGVVQIAEAVRHNEAVQLLAVFDNNVDEETKQDIKMLFSDRPDLQLYV